MASNSNVSTNPDQLLTVDELLAMPETDYMNAAQLAFFQNRLRELEKEILAQCRAQPLKTYEKPSLCQTQQTALLSKRSTLSNYVPVTANASCLKKYSNHLALIDSGEYGWCEETGEPIGLRRLLARPTANLSLEAQERREKRQKALR